MSALVRYSRSATQVGAGNTAGQHTDAILTELGLGAQIVELRDAGIVA
jgi:crotonobetainyl-CoA:carnitine CoA-transferase CaiB-like acyl-CoA transferase